MSRGGYRGGASGRPPPPDALRGGRRPPLGPQQERFVPLFPLQVNNITNIIFFILIVKTLLKNIVIANSYIIKLLLSV